MYHVILTYPFQGRFVISRLELATINPQTKFEVSNYIHYEDMKSGAKCTNWGSLGQLGVTRCHCNVTIAYMISYSTLIETMSVLYYFRDVVSYLSKLADCNAPQLHLVPLMGMTLVEFRGSLWHHKTRVPDLSCGIVYVILCLAILVDL